MHLSHYSNTQTLFIWVTFTTTCTWEDRITDPIIKENIYSDPYIYELSSSTNADLIIRFCWNGSQSHCHKFSLISLEGLLVKRAKSKPPILTAICTSGFGHTQWVTRRKWTCCVVCASIEYCPSNHILWAWTAVSSNWITFRAKHKKKTTISKDTTRDNLKIHGTYPSLITWALAIFYN